MAFNESLAEKVRIVLLSRSGITEKKMFGGLCYLLNGNMCCGLVGEKLMLRVSAEDYPRLLKHKHVAPMDFTGRPLTGLIYLLPSGLKTTSAVAKWIEVALSFAGSLPKKTKTKKPTKN